MTQQRLRLLAAGIALVPTFGYPFGVLALGTPPFPTRDDCVHVATGDAEDLEVVYGRLDDPVAADELLAEVTRIGFVGAEVEFDACGRWKVSYDAVETFAQGEALAEHVREAGLEARVEHER
ncbi:MAG TPA: hypothetical protein VNB06_03595 [Thermoanaerobaculia bacterium]|nr:hypothetical protein [Thermoanaerobaculia bacterium]